MKKLVLKLIDNYQKNISSITKPHCRFYPTCSEYAKQCFERFNFFKATLLSVYRLIRCNPLAKGGYDPVPEKKPRLVPITNNLFYIENTYNTDRPAIGYYHYNGKALLIDAGNSDRHAKLIQKTIKKAKLPKPSLAIITHYHWDHSYALPYYNIDAIALKETKENLDKQDYSFNKKNLLEHFSDETIPLFSYDHFRLEYKHSLKKVQKPIITKVISEDTKFYLENQLIYLLKFPSNHTNDTLAVFFKETKIIFLGDALCGKICGNDFISSQDTISQQIKYLEKLDFDLAITSHEKPLSKPEIIKALTEQLSK